MDRYRKSMYGFALLSAILPMQATATQAATLVPFAQFYQKALATTLADQTIKSDSRVNDPVAFAAMRNHVATLYSGVVVKHSFLLDNRAWDCVPMLQQPSVRQLGLEVIATPPTPPILTGITAQANSLNQISQTETVDALGNSTECESGTIPMLRLTIDDLARFKTLEEFFRKDHVTIRKFGAPGENPFTHAYAHSFTHVPNRGGSSYHNVWNPHVNNASDAPFSLSQFWYANTSGITQTVEMGWQNSPRMWNTNNSVLFIYYTRGNYVDGSGCYNLTCAGFVQTNKHIYLGKGFPSYSVDGGSQFDVRLTAFLSNGNWWLYVGGISTSNAIGYYPASAYKGGAMTKGANYIDYGGEVYPGLSGVVTWPTMGSGSYAYSGFGHASYIRKIQYIPMTGASITPGLDSESTANNCYTIDEKNSSSDPNFGTFLFFGGPGNVLASSCSIF